MTCTCTISVILTPKAKRFQFFITTQITNTLFGTLVNIIRILILNKNINDSNKLINNT